MSEGNSKLLGGGQAQPTVLLNQLLQYGVALLSVVLALGTNLLFHPYLEPTPTPLFFAAVMVAAWYGGLGPGLLATALSTLAINYFYIEPLHSLNINNLAYWVRLSTFVIAALSINSLNQAQRAAQRKAEASLKALRESEARFGCLAESNIIGMIVADLNGAILEANDIFLQMVGYTQEELRSGRMRWHEMTPPESLEVSEKAIQELLTTGACMPFEKEYIRKDGSRIPVLHGAVMTGKTTVTGFVLDLSQRKRIEESLASTNQTLQTLLDACPVAIAFFDPQGIVRLWNRAAESIFGWSAAEAIGQFMPTVAHRPQEFLANIQTVLSGRSLDGLEVQHQRKDGQVVDLEIWANLARDAEGNLGCLGIAWEISQRKQTEAALRQSEERLRIAQQAAKAGVWDWDIATNQVTWSEEYYHLYGLNPATTQPSYENWLASIVEQDRDRAARSARESLKHQTNLNVEFRILHPTQGERWITAIGQTFYAANQQPLRMTGIALDITERKQAEEALRQSEARFQVLVSNIPGMVYRYAPCTDGPDTFTYVSSGSYELTELEPETILQDASSFLALIHGDDLASFQDSVAIAIENSTLWQWEGRLIAPSGQLKWVQARSRPEQTEYGQVWDGLFFDITERKQAEEALRQSEERLRVALKSSPITVFNQDRELRYTWIYNPAFGHLATEVIGKQDRDLLSEDDATILTRIKRRVLETGSGLREEVKLTMQGQDFYYDLTVEPLLDVNGETVGITCASIDITERKQMELALRQSESTFSSLIASSPIGIAFLDRDLRYIHMNEALAATNGIPLSEHLGRTLWEVLPEWASVLAPLMQQVMQTQEPLLNQEVVGVTHPSDKVRHGLVNYFPVCLSDGEVLGVGVTLIDITQRRLMEESLRQSEERYRTIYDQVLTGISQVDLAGNFMSANERFCEIVGRSPEELLTLRMQEILHPDDLRHNLVLFQQMLNDGTSFEIEKRYVRPDGSHVWVRNYVSLMRDAAGQPQCGLAVTEDITQQKQAEADLNEQRQLLETMVAASPLPIVAIEPDMTVKLWNAAAEQLFGWSEAQLLGQRLPIVPEEKQEECRQLREAVINGEVFFGVETYRCKRDGAQVILSISAAPLYDERGSANGILLILQDITERQQAEAKLRDSEERLRLALTAANQGLYDLNVQTGDAIVSPEYARMLGYEPEEFQETNANWRDRLHPDDVAIVYQAYQDYVAGQLETYRVEFRQRTKSGDWKWILSIGKIVAWDGDGQPLRMLGTHTDITDRKQAETEREQLLLREQTAREQAETANRIKDEFLAVLSHELRSPLNPILGWSRLLQTQKLDEQKTQLALATIERNAKLQTQLIDDLLDVSRILRGKLMLNIAPVSLSNTIEAALETVRLAVEAKGIQVQTAFNLDADRVMGDAARLQQVIWNLLTNAVKFTPSGGTVEIKLEAINTHVQIQVKDTGKGINPEFLPYVFDYFRQEDGTITRKFGGLGLGLAIVRHITELHGGTVQAESLGEGQGATFTVRLPLMAMTTESDETVPMTEHPVDLNRLRILVVDDEEDMRTLVQAALEQQGATVMVATSAAEVLALFELQLPDLLISDIGMPDMDGYMLMQQIRNRSAEKGGLIPAIALTAYASEFYQQQAIQAGFQQHISKPVEPKELIKAIVNLVGSAAI